MPLKCCIIHTTEDARHFLSHYANAHDWRIYATHPSLVDFMTAQSVPCHDISIYLTAKNGLDIKLASYPGGPLHEQRMLLQKELRYPLPERYALPQLKKHFDLTEAAFSSQLFLGFYAHAAFAHCLKNAYTRHKYEEILFYEQRAFERLYLLPEMNSRLIADDGDIPPIRYEWSGSRPNEQVTVGNMLAPEPLTLRSYLRKGMINKFRLLQRPSRTTLLLFESPYDLEPALRERRAFTTLTWPQQKLPVPHDTDNDIQAESKRQTAFMLKHLRGCHCSTALNKAFKKTYIRHIERHGTDIFSALHAAKKIAASKQIHAVAWGNSPGAAPYKALACKYFMAAGIPVFGMQHGANYGVKDSGFKHVVQDYRYCTHFFSYGFGWKNLADKLKKHIPCQIVPNGSTRLPSPRTIRTFRPTKNRVVFPLTFPMSATINTRVSPAILAEYQNSIISSLSQHPNLDVWLKPFKTFSGSPPSWLSLAEKTPHMHVTGSPFTYYLHSMQPSLVIIEYPSSPLFDALPYDVDIFMLPDPCLPFHEQARQMIERRCHVFESPEALCQALLDYPQSAEPKRRCSEYYEHFIYKKNAKRNLIKNISNGIRQQQS